MENLTEISEICKRHFKDFPCAIQYVPEQYLTEELCIAAIKGSCRSNWEENDIWEYIPINMLSPEVCKVAALCNRYTLDHIPNECKTADVFFEAVKGFGELLICVPKAFQSKEMYINAVNQNGGNLKFVPQSERTEEICLAAFNSKSNGAKAVEYIPDRFLTEEMCKQAVTQEWETLKVIPNHFKNADVCSCALQHSIWADKVDDKPDKSFSQFVNDYIPDNISEEVCRKFMEYAAQIKREKSERREWVRRVAENPLYIKNIPIEKRDSQICEIAIKQEGMMLKYVPQQLRMKMLCDIAVRNNADAIIYVPDEIRSEVIKSVKSSYQYVRILFSDSKFKDYFI